MKKRLTIFLTIGLMALGLFAQDREHYIRLGDLMKPKGNTFAFNLDQNLRITDSPTFAGLTIGMAHPILNTGTVPLTADWNVGAFRLTAPSLILSKIPVDGASQTQLSLTYNGTGFITTSDNASINSLSISNLANSGSVNLYKYSLIGVGVNVWQKGTGSIAYLVGADYSVATDSTGTTQQMEGTAGYCLVRAGTATKVYGGYFYGIAQCFNNTSAITTLYALKAKAIASAMVSGTATIATAYGVHSSVGAENMIGGTPSITNGYAFYAANYTAELGFTARPITNLYQIYIEKPTLGSAINKAIYVAGGEVDLRDGFVTSSMISNADSDTNEVDSVTWAGGYGMIIAASVTDNKSAIWRLAGTTLSAVSVDVAFTATKDNTATYNIYFEGGAIKLQNKVGDNKVVKLGFFGI